MSITELIAALEAMREEHGDLQVGYENNDACVIEAIGQVWFHETDFEQQPFHDNESLGGWCIVIG